LLTRFARGWGITPLVAAIVVALDQWTKAIVEANIPYGSAWAPIPGLSSWFNIVYLTNTGAAFGIFRGQAGIFVIIALVVIVSVLIYARYLPSGNALIHVCLGLQLGGAAGNLIDRLQHAGNVTDFVLVTVPLGGRVLVCPAFNVADSAIVVGVALLALVLLRSGPESPSTAHASREGPSV
jgi:signal peptidase II